MYFLVFFMNFIFLHLKKRELNIAEDQGNCNILLPFCFKHPILQIILFTNMKLCLYAGNMHLNIKDEKSMWKYKN